MSHLTVKHWAILAGAYISAVPAMSQSIVINEFMASNGSTIADEDGDFEDWIELFNAGSQPVNLAGWGLSDDLDRPFRWVFPDLILPPGEYLLVWASGKDRVLSGSPLHANFSISADGEHVLLTDATETRIDQVSPIELPRDISYGRFPDGAPSWYYYDAPTPNAANATTAYIGLLEPPVFSVDPGFYDDPVVLEIGHPEHDVSIIYSTDGSFPSGHANVFTEALTLTSLDNQPNGLSTVVTSPPESLPLRFGWKAPLDRVAKAHTIRAVAVKDGYFSPAAASGTWFVGRDFADRYHVNVVSLMADEDDLFDHKEGIYVPGELYADSGYGDDYWGRPYANYHQRGADWERQVFFEYFNQSTGLRASWGDVGVRIHGGGSRTIAQKSLRLYHRRGLSGPSLEYPFFEELLDDAYRRLILRNSGQDWYANGPTMLKCGYVQRLVRHMNFETQAYHPTVVFLNGEFWGIHNLRERIDHYYIARHFDVDPEAIDLLTGNARPQQGTADHYTAMLDYIDDHSLSDPAHYAHIQTLMDVDCYIDYVIANTFLANDDWPGNNVDYWRLQADYAPEAPKGHDGRWRWIMFDMDFAVNQNNVSKDMFHFLRFPSGGWPNPSWSVFLINRLWENEQFVENFCTRYANHLNSTFLSHRASELADEMAAVIEDDIVEHFRRWGRDVSIYEWQQNIERLKAFASQRADYVWNHLNYHFDLGGWTSVTINHSMPSKGIISVNGMLLDGARTPGVEGRPKEWSGRYFRNIPITVTAIAEPGYRFSHWDGPAGIDPVSETLTLSLTSDVALTAHFEPLTLVHYWHCTNEMPNNTPFESVDSTYGIVDLAFIEYHSALAGYPFDSDHPDWRKASLERRNAPTELNYRLRGNQHLSYDENVMRGLQVKQPFVGDGGQNVMIFHLPTTGYRDVVFSFAAKDEGAVEGLLVDYAVTASSPVWQTFGLDTTAFALTKVYELYEIDFSSIPQADNNPDFMVRIRFEVADGQANDANRVTFNNIALDGVLLNVFGNLGLFAQWWLESDCSLYDHCAGADLNRDGRVDLDDFAILAGQWMMCTAYE